MGLGRGPVSSSPTLGRVCCQQVAKASTGLPTPTLRLRLAGGSDLQAPLPQLRKERQSPPWQKCENPEIIRNPGGPGPYEIVAVFARTCLHVGEYARVHVARLHLRPRKALSPSGLLGAVG